jgi:hypothetical protein
VTRSAQPASTLHFGGVMYASTLGLLTGLVAPRGVQLRWEIVPDITELFRRVCADAEFEAAEISLSSFTAMVSWGDNRYVGSRCFRLDASATALCSSARIDASTAPGTSPVSWLASRSTK